MKKDEHFKIIIEEFFKWYNNDSHRENITYYEDFINKEYIQSLTDENFIDFFYEFVSKGGKIQSGGSRSKNKFKKTIGSNINSFRSYVIEPFNIDFNLNNWFKRIKNYNGFGVGIATIYLNRVNRNKYSVMNNKTLKALNKLGYQLSSSKNFKNYLKVNKIQNQLIKKFPELDNLYITDALNHFIVAVYRGQDLINSYYQLKSAKNTYEQNEIESLTYSKNKKETQDDLLKIIKECESDSSDLITIKGKKFKRNNYLMVQIKKYRNYQCQFCSTKIKKANGEYYIEACHIIPKASNGKDKLNNILILCPNCHKTFDYGKRKNEKKNKKSYSVTLNGIKYKASLI